MFGTDLTSESQAGQAGVNDHDGGVSAIVDHFDVLARYSHLRSYYLNRDHPEAVTNTMGCPYHLEKKFLRTFITMS